VIDSAEPTRSRDHYRQCVLRKGNRSQVSWIPARFASIGQTLKLKREDGTWNNGWVVMSVSAAVEEDEIVDSNAARRKHRRNTGDALRK
jgi:hypothetical protein